LPIAKKVGNAMKIGDMKQRITLLKPAISVNENGFETEGYEAYKTLWASVSNLSGREYFAAASVQAEDTVKFVIRHIGDIDSSMRISFREKQYNITFIDNLKYENRYIEIKAMEVGEHG